MNAYTKAYVKWFFYHNRKRIWLYLGVCAVLIQIPDLAFYFNDTVGHMPLENGVNVLLVILLITAPCLAVLLFQYLMKKRACDLFLPLPISKCRMFFIHYGIGTLLLAMPVILFLLTALLFPETRSFLSYLGIYAIGLYIMTLTAFSVYVFVVVKCNSLWDAMIAVVGYMILQVMAAAMIESMLSSVVNQVLVGGGSVAEFFPIRMFEGLVSPLLASVRWLDGLLSAYYVQIGEEVSFLSRWFARSDVSLWLFLWHILLCVMFTIGGLRSYVMRKGESSEQKTTSKWIYPLLMYGLTGLMIAFTTISLSTGIGSFWVIALLFLALNFAAERKITLRISRVFCLVCLLIGFSAIIQVMTMTKGFYLIHEFYDREEITAVSIYIDMYDDEEEVNLESLQYLEMYDFSDDSDLIDQILNYQHTLVDKANQGQLSGFISIRYRLDDYSEIYRGYPIYIQDRDTAVEIITYLVKHDLAVLQNSQ